MKFLSEDKLIADVEILHSGGYSNCEIIEYLNADSDVVLSRHTKDISGMRFGKLTAFVVYQGKPSIGNAARWVCLCDCGNATIVYSRDLIRLHTRSCGCLLVKDLTGKRFGRLVVVGLCSERNKGNTTQWLCQCDCGEIAIVRAGGLRQGTKSCGCLNMEMRAARCGINNPAWNPDLTDEERENRRDYKEYDEWRGAVYERDGYTCQKCGEVGNSINAHHIEAFNTSKDLRTTLNNGITLCVDCHDNFHRVYGRGGNTRAQFDEWMFSK